MRLVHQSKAHSARKKKKKLEARNHFHYKFVCITHYMRTRTTDRQGGNIFHCDASACNPIRHSAVTDSSVGSAAIISPREQEQEQVRESQRSRLQRNHNPQPTSQERRAGRAETGWLRKASRQAGRQPLMCYNTEINETTLMR